MKEGRFRFDCDLAITCATYKLTAIHFIFIYFFYFPHKKNALVDSLGCIRRASPYFCSEIKMLLLYSVIYDSSIDLSYGRSTISFLKHFLFSFSNMNTVKNLYSIRKLLKVFHLGDRPCPAWHLLIHYFASLRFCFSYLE